MFLGYDLTHTHYTDRSIRNRFTHLDKRDSQSNAAGRLWTGNPLYMIRDHMDGSKEATYHVNLIYLLDRVFLRDSMEPMSIAQDRYLKKFFTQAWVVNDKIDSNNSDTDTSNDVDPYGDMDEVMKQLDNFLGSYFGVEHGRFTR